MVYPTLPNSCHVERKGGILTMLNFLTFQRNFYKFLAFPFNYSNQQECIKERVQCTMAFEVESVPVLKTVSLAYPFSRSSTEASIL